MIALNLSNDNRILSACKVLPSGSYTNMPIVDTLPEGNISDYQYIDDEFIYNPLPKEEPVEPTLTLEDRVTALEQTVNTTVSEYTTVLQELGVET